MVGGAADGGTVERGRNCARDGGGELSDSTRTVDVVVETVASAVVDSVDSVSVLSACVAAVDEEVSAVSSAAGVSVSASGTCSTVVDSEGELKYKFLDEDDERIFTIQWSTPPQLWTRIQLWTLPQLLTLLEW